MGYGGLTFPVMIKQPQPSHPRGVEWGGGDALPTTTETSLCLCYSKLLRRLLLSPSPSVYFYIISIITTARAGIYNNNTSQYTITYLCYLNLDPLLL